MKELLTLWTYWLPVLLSAAVLLLYAVLLPRRGPLIPLAIVMVITLIYFAVIPKERFTFSTVLVSVSLACALDGLIGWWRTASPAIRIGLLVLVIVPLVICGVAEATYSTGTFILFLFLFLLSAIYILPRRQYAQGKPGRHLALWAAQLVVVCIFTLPGIIQMDFRILYYLNSEGGLITGLWLMPTLACIPLVIYDIYCAKQVY